jgi:hypothetical protein
MVAAINHGACSDRPFDFTQNIAFDTSRIRTELGYRGIVF